MIASLARCQHVLRRVLTPGLLSAVIASACAAPAAASRYERYVRAYEKLDQVDPPPRHAILLVGDSQFYRWKTAAADLSGYTIINRGIDGFELSDLVHFADRLVIPYDPRLIVLHVGGNDAHNGKTPAQVRADLVELVARIRSRYPDVPIIFSSITPGPARWNEADRRREINRVVREYVATQPRMTYLDLWNAMLTPEGRPREDIWAADRIHPNHAGYLIRVRLIRPLLGPPDRIQASR